MQAQVTLTGDVKAIANVMAKLAGAGGVAGEVVEPKRGRGRPKKETVEATAEADDDLGLGASEEETENEGDESEEAGSEETEEETEEEESEPAPRKGATTSKSGKTKGKALTLEGDIIPAFQNFAKKHSREKAAKILAKFKAKKVTELSPNSYGEVLSLLAKG